MAQACVSVVVVSYNEGEHLARTVDSLLASLPATSEIIVFDDCSTDGSADSLNGTRPKVNVIHSPKRVGACVGRNSGARRASGEVVVFSDAHVEVPRRWVPEITAALTCAAVGAVGVAISDLNHRANVGYGFRFIDAGLNTEWLERQGGALYPVPLLGAAFLAMRREVFQAVGGFDPAMFWGMEDLELCVRLWMLGYECLLAPGIEVAHLDQWGANPEYQLNWEEGLHNTLRLAILHFGRDRIRRVMQHYADDRLFPASLARLATGNAWTRRAQLLAQRSYDDDWYFGRFNMEL